MRMVLNLTGGPSKAAYQNNDTEIHEYLWRQSISRERQNHNSGLNEMKKSRPRRDVKMAGCSQRGNP